MKFKLGSLVIFCMLLSCGQKSKYQKLGKQDGSPLMVYSENFDKPLFILSESNKLTSFEEWVRENFNYDKSRFDIRALEVIPGTDNIMSTKKVTTFKINQTYRGFPVLGPSSEINLILVDKKEVYAISGSVIDQSIEFKGIDDRFPLEKIIEIVNQSLNENFNTEPLNDNYTIDYFAYPELKQMVYKVCVKRTSLSPDIMYFIAAASGEILAKEELRYNDITDNWPISVSVKAFDNQLNEAQPQALLLPTYGSIFNFNNARLGNSALVMYDFRDMENVPNVIFRSRLRSDGGPGVGIGTEPFFAPLFSGRDEGERRAINIFHKLSAGINWIESIRSAGLSHPDNSPLQGTNQLPPLIVLANRPTINSAEIIFSTFDMPSPPEEPDFIYNNTEYDLALMTLPNDRVYSIFHELGHFYDQYLGFGILGEDYLSKTCIPDSHDESKPMRETFANLFAMCLIRKLYPDLPYDLSSTSSNCDLVEVAGRNWPIHSPNCASTIARFENDRPASAGNGTGCNASAGYNQHAIHQAFWEFISGQQCEPNPPFNCTQTNVHVDMALDAMIHALQAGNHVSYQQFFLMMRIYFVHEYGSEIGDTFAEIFEHHGFEF